MRYKFHSKLAIRFPVFSLDNIFRETEMDFIHDERFKEAVFIASPDFANAFYGGNDQIRNDLKESLLKYYNRMSYRSTPFGLFAVCATLDWHKTTNICLVEEAFYRRTRLDKEFLSKIGLKLIASDAVFKYLKVSLNNTIYQVGNTSRLIERSDDKMELNISSFANSENYNYFVDLINQEKGVVQDIIKKASLNGISPKKSFEYLKILRDNQIIATNLEVGIPAKELLESWIQTLANIQGMARSVASIWHKDLTAISEALKNIDKLSKPNINKYDSIFSIAKKIGFEQSSKKIIQVDVGYKGTAGTINSALQRKLSKGIDILKFINTGEEQNSALNSFKKKFFKKFEYQKMPLLVALDPELGIDYLDGYASFDDFLTKELGVLTKNDHSKQRLLSHNLRIIERKYEQAILMGLHCINLKDDDIAEFEETKYELPTTSSVFFKLIDDDTVQLEYVGGSTGINLIGRFTDFNTELKSIATDLADFEQIVENDTILAEVIHEPEPRSGNVTAISSFRSYEIPYYTQSGIAEERIIPLTDICLFFNNDKLHLWSRKLDRLIKPIISNAYNYKKSSPVFRFLGDLQTQSSSTLSFDFRKLLPNKLFYPQLVYNKDIVFSPAMWNVHLEDISKLKSESIAESTLRYLKDFKVPDIFIIVEGDNELLIDINRQWLLELFIKLLVKKKNLLLKEFLYCKDSYPVKLNNKPVNNQMIAFLIADERIGQESKVVPPAQQSIKRTFELGSEWLYYKIYCGVVSGDRILPEIVLPLILELKRCRLIDGTFFIRFNDPESHIRLRFLLIDKQKLYQIINIIANAFKTSEESGKIWKIQTENYRRELERYQPVMPESEKLFFIDSISILKLLDTTLINESIHMRIAAGIRLSFDLLKSADLSLPDLISFTKRSKIILKKECDINLFSQKRINNNYRDFSSLYESFLLSTPKSVNSIFLKRYNSLKELMGSIRQKALLSAQERTMENLLSSYIHMSVNRLFGSNQKVYEYIIYDYLYKKLSRDNSTLK